MGDPNRSTPRHIARYRWRWNRSRIAEFATWLAGAILGIIIAANYDFDNLWQIAGFCLGFPFAILTVGVLARHLAAPNNDDNP